MKLKDKILYMISVLVAMMATSCTEDSDMTSGSVKPSLMSYYLFVDTQDKTLSSDAQTWNTTVHAGANSWQFEGLADWLSVTPECGIGELWVDMAATRNMSGDESRTSIFYLNSQETDWHYSARMSVTQAETQPFVQIKGDSRYKELSGEEQIIEIPYEANCQVEASLQCSSYDRWFDVLSNESNVLKLKIYENLDEARTMVVKLMSKQNNTVADQIIITQRRANVVITGSAKIELPNTPATYKVNVTAEASWTAYTPASWISVTPNQGKKGTTEVEISTTANVYTQSRTGYVYLYIGAKETLVLKVYQEGLFVKAGDRIDNVSSLGETLQFTVTSNVKWEVQPSVDWLSVTPATGSEETLVTLKVEDNPSLSSRKGKLIFTSPLTDLHVEKEIVQNGKFFEVKGEKLTFSDKATTQTVEVNSDGRWTATKREDYDWMMISPESENGNGKLNISVLENKTKEERYGYVDVSMYGKKHEIFVHQDSKYFYVDLTENSFSSHGGTSALFVRTNDAWKASVKDGLPWISLDQTEGTAECDLNVTLADNPSTKKRSGCVEVHTENVGYAEVYYNQDGRYLTADVPEFSFFAKGGTSKLVTIRTDGQYEVKQEGDWFQVGWIDNNSFTVTVPVNDGDTERTGSITLRLTDLKDEEFELVLPVKQISKYSSFTKGDYKEDVSWDLITTPHATITVKKYAADKSWDIDTKSNGKITFTGYGGDRNWNTSTKPHGNISGTGFGKDQDWNNK